MPNRVRRMRPNGNPFPIEWNKIVEWFQWLSAEYLKTDGSIRLDHDQAGVMLGVRWREEFRYVETTESIASESQGEASKLKFDFGSGSYQLLDPEHKFQIRTDISQESLFSGERVVVGRFRDGQWQVIPTGVAGPGTGNTTVTGRALQRIERNDTGIFVLDNTTGSIVDNVFEPGQLSSSLTVLPQTTVTFVQETGLLVSVDCDNAVAPDPLAPVAVDDDYMVNEDSVLNVVFPGVLANDTDPQSDPLTVDTGTQGGPFNGSLTLNTNGSFSYAPDPDFNGVDIFTYECTDGTTNSIAATVTITVNPVNDPPVANDDNYSTPKNTTLPVTAPGVLDNDTDVDGDALVVSPASTGVSATANGSVTLNSDGSFVYDPNPGFDGTDTFTYFANDGTDDSALAATVTITVT